MFLLNHMTCTKSPVMSLLISSSWRSSLSRCVLYYWKCGKAPGTYSSSIYNIEWQVEKNWYDTYCDTHKAIRDTYWRYDIKVNIWGHWEWRLIDAERNRSSFSWSIIIQSDNLFKCPWFALKEFSLKKGFFGGQTIKKWDFVFFWGSILRYLNILSEVVWMLKRIVPGRHSMTGA